MRSKVFRERNGENPAATTTTYVISTRKLGNVCCKPIPPVFLLLFLCVGAFTCLTRTFGNSKIYERKSHCKQTQSHKHEYCVFFRVFLSLPGNSLSLSRTLSFFLCLLRFFVRLLLLL